MMIYFLWMADDIVTNKHMVCECGVSDIIIHMEGKNPFPLFQLKLFLYLLSTASNCEVLKNKRAETYISCFICIQFLHSAFFLVLSGIIVILLWKEYCGNFIP